MDKFFVFFVCPSSKPTYPITKSSASHRREIYNSMIKDHGSLLTKTIFFITKFIILRIRYKNIFIINFKIMIFSRFFFIKLFAEIHWGILLLILFEMLFLKVFLDLIIWIRFACLFIWWCHFLFYILWSNFLVKSLF